MLWGPSQLVVILLGLFLPGFSREANEQPYFVSRVAGNREAIVWVLLDFFVCKGRDYHYLCRRRRCCWTVLVLVMIVRVFRDYARMLEQW